MIEGLLANVMLQMENFSGIFWGALSIAMKVNNMQLKILLFHGSIMSQDTFT